MKRKTLRAIFNLMMISILAIQITYAFGVTSKYTREEPLKMQPGDTIDAVLYLQNMVGNDDMILTGSIGKGSDIATITDKDTSYDVPHGVKGIPVNIRISIPEDTQLGTKYDILVTFTQSSNNDEGMLQMAGAVEKLIPVVVGEEQSKPEPAPVQAAPAKQPYPYSSLIILVCLIIAALLWYMYITRKKNAEGSSK